MLNTTNIKLVKKKQKGRVVGRGEGGGGGRGERGERGVAAEKARRRRWGKKKEFS